MYKLVIIEDEVIVRKNIIKKIKWSEYGFEVVGQAENGKEALEVIEATNPDVIITDIEMPFMDGLELSSIVREKYPTIKIILLTGYDDFKYAQKAVELNVIEYVLKPVSSENINKVLIKVKEQIDKEISEKEEVDKLKEYYHRSIPIMKINFLNNLINGRMNKEEVSNMCKRFNISFNGSKFLVAVISIDKSSLEKTKFRDEDYELVKFAVLNTAEEITDKYSVGNVFYYDRYIVCLYSFDTDNKNKAFRILEEIRQTIEKYMKITIIIGIGNWCNNIEDISESYKNAITALDYRFVLENNKIIYIEDIEPQNHKRIIFDDSKEHNILTSIKVGNTEDINNTIEDIFNEIKESNISFCEYQIYILQLLSTVVKVINSLTLNLEDIFGENSNLFNEMFSFGTIEEVEVWFKGVCTKLTDYITNRRQNSCKTYVEQAKQYILENYNDSKISINKVINHLHISPSYFGAIFKEETGETFVNFLQKVRMEKARDLICTTNLKNFDIAENVGYADQYYFSYCFKKYFKISPNELRNSLTKA